MSAETKNGRMATWKIALLVIVGMIAAILVLMMVACPSKARDRNDAAPVAAAGTNESSELKEARKKYDDAQQRLIDVLQKQLGDCQSGNKKAAPVVKHVSKRHSEAPPRKEAPPAPAPIPEPAKVAKAEPQPAPIPQVIVVRVETTSSTSRRETERDVYREERREVRRTYDDDYYPPPPRIVVRPRVWYPESYGGEGQQNFYISPGYGHSRNFRGGNWYPGRQGGPHNVGTPGSTGGPHNVGTPGPIGGGWQPPTGGGPHNVGTPGPHGVGTPGSSGRRR